MHTLSIEVNSLISSPLDLDTILENVMTISKKVINAEHGVYVLSVFADERIGLAYVGKTDAIMGKTDAIMGKTDAIESIKDTAQNLKELQTT